MTYFITIARARNPGFDQMLQHDKVTTFRVAYAEASAALYSGKKKRRTNDKITLSAYYPITL